MDAPEGIWRKDNTRHSEGYHYLLGRICVGSVGYALQSRNDPTRYRAEVRLPGVTIKDDAALKPTVEEAKAVVERVVGAWFVRVSEASEQAEAA